MIDRPVIPTVLVVVNRNSQIEVFQDKDVLVAFADERADNRSVILLPMENQAIELYERLDGKIGVSRTKDHGDTARNAIQQLRSLSIITTGLKADKEAS
jgi:hypothetical protein